MTENIIIPDPERLEKIKRNFKKAGPEAAHILSDFDRTLTYHCQSGRKNSALISVLSEAGYMPPEYLIKTEELYDKYYPIEHDPDIPLEEKKAAMVKWWSEVFGLFISYGLTKEIVERAMTDSGIKLRDDVEDWLDLLERFKVPLIIFSASGLGLEAIDIFLDRLEKHNPNIHILANSLIWDETGKAIGVRQPIIHSYNKDETLIHNFPFFNEIKNRRNVILLGDSLGDVGMADGFDYNNLLKIGFLNERVEDNLTGFKQVYDIVILGDASFAYINRLFKEIF